MTENTRSSELRKEIEFRLEMADSKPTPEAINSIEALIASKVEEALENHKKVMKLADTYTFEDGTQFVKVKALQSKEGRNGK